MGVFRRTTVVLGGLVLAGSAVLAPANASVAASQLAAGLPSVGQASTGQPTVGQRTAGQLTVGEPTAGQPSAGLPSVGRPAAGRASAGQPSVGRTAAGEPTAGQPTTAEPSADQPTAEPTPPGEWKVRWQDTFDGDALDEAKWTTWSASYSDDCRGNKPDHKLEYNLPDNLEVADGQLKITAKRQDYTAPSGERYEWTSGLATTGDSCGHDPADGVRVEKGDYIQVRVKQPPELGMWPAFWTWNEGGNEVDVYEYHRDNPNLLELTNHTPGGGGYYYDTGQDLAAGWHHIGAYLGADRVEWYVDGKKVQSDAGFNSDGAYLIVDLAVADGEFHPAPPAEVTEATMAVDSVSVFRSS